MAGRDAGVFAAHDYPALLRRWRRIARRARLELEILAQNDGWPVVMLRRGEVGFYISAGIHGDEPAGCEALATWAEQDEFLLRKAEFAIFPCLNPWGLVHNSRRDARGRDLNRWYDRNGSAVVTAHRRVLRGCVFRRALTLHEDYDARGVYLYEVGRDCGADGRRILAAATGALPLESRRRIEGLPCDRGIIRRKSPRGHLEGLPEALWLARAGCPGVWTLETPSEMDLRQRVEAHRLGIAEFLRLESAALR